MMNELVYKYNMKWQDVRSFLKPFDYAYQNGYDLVVTTNQGDIEINDGDVIIKNNRILTINNIEYIK